MEKLYEVSTNPQFKTNWANEFASYLFEGHLLQIYEF